MIKAITAREIIDEIDQFRHFMWKVMEACGGLDGAQRGSTTMNCIHVRQALDQIRRDFGYMEPDDTTNEQTMARKPYDWDEVGKTTKDNI